MSMGLVHVVTTEHRDTVMTVKTGQYRLPPLYRVQYLHKPTGEVASFQPTSRSGALEVAWQLAFDGEDDVRIIALSDDSCWTLEAFSAARS